MNTDTYVHGFRLRFDGETRRISIEAPIGATTMDIVKALDGAHFLLKKTRKGHTLEDVLDRACSQNGWTWAPAKEATYVYFD